VSFQEYLLARGETLLAAAYNQVPFPAEAFDSAMALFHEYAQIGGMPEIVRKSLQGRPFFEISATYESLFQSFVDDVQKYVHDEERARLIKTLIEISPLEAGKRIKFENFGRTGLRSKDVGECLRVLERAMLLKLIYPTTAMTPPLLPDRTRSPLLQVLDTGLINLKANLFEQHFSLRNLEGLYHGRVLEHLVRQEVLASNTSATEEALFWVREKSGTSAEIDLILDVQGEIVPVEVKSDKAGRLRSLHYFLDHCSSTCAIRLYSSVFKAEHLTTPNGKSFELVNVPYFHAAKIRAYLN
jgi:uncharacterized protein